MFNSKFYKCLDLECTRASPALVNVRVDLCQ